MDKVLVVYADRHLTTATIARAAGDQLTKDGFQVDVRRAAAAPDAWKYAAVIVGSPTSAGRWRRDVIHYLRAQAPDLAERPTWLFQCLEESRGQDGHHIPPVVSRLCFEVDAGPIKTFRENARHTEVTEWARRIGDHLHAGVLTPA